MNEYRIEQSDNKRWWFVILATKADPMGKIVGERFSEKMKAKLYKRELERLGR